jgi:uncharacterized membrane protein YoaK (UPF0700 family)
MITTLISTEAEKYTSEVVSAPQRTFDPEIGLLCGIWIAFVLGAGMGAEMVLRFKALGMLGAALLLIALMVHNSMDSRQTRRPTKGLDEESHSAG